MKIFINARFLTQPISGVQRYGIECSRQILKIHTDVVFLAPADIIHHDLAQEFNVKIIGTYKGHNWEQIDLPLYLEQLGSPPLLCMGNAAPVAYKNTYVTIHDLAFMQKHRWNNLFFVSWYKWMIPKIAKKAKHIFTVSNAMKAEIQEILYVPADQISVTYNGIAEHLLSTKEHTSKEKIILSVGSFNLRKNHEKLIQAFLQSSIKDEYTLIIIGDKYKVFKHTGLDDQELQTTNIKIMEGLTDEALAELYQKAEIVASLSAYEGFGIPLLEGLHFNCKIICSDIPAYKELYDNYAYFCNPENIPGISKLLEEIAAAPYQPADTGLLAEKYNYLNSARTIVEVIEANSNV